MVWQQFGPRKQTTPHADQTHLNQPQDTNRRTFFPSCACKHIQKVDRSPHTPHEWLQCGAFDTPIAR